MKKINYLLSLTIILTSFAISAQPCIADFSYTANNNTANFVNNSNVFFAYTWDFGDGNTSSQMNPSHTYAAPGGYGVTLTAFDSTGSCTTYDTVYVNYCSVFYWYTNVGNGVVNFNSNYFASNQVDYVWDFGDGSPNVFNTKAPIHTYANSGTYIATITLYDSLTNSNCSYTDSINVTVSTNCNASFTAVKDTTSPFSVILYNTSTSHASHSYSWNFGDGSFGTGRTPNHFYQNFGSYAVCLTITDSILNCTSTFCDSVGMDSLGNLKAVGFGLDVRNPVIVGVEETEILNAISVFPNPANNNLTIDLRSIDSPINVKLMDISGRSILELPQTSINKIERLDLSQYENGFYFLLMNDGKNQRIEKIIISH